MDRPKRLPNGLGETLAGGVITGNQPRGVVRIGPIDFDFPDLQHQRCLFSANVRVIANQRLGQLTGRPKRKQPSLKLCSFGGGNAKPLDLIPARIRVRAASYNQNSAVRPDRYIVVGANAGANRVP